MKNVVVTSVLALAALSACGSGDDAESERPSSDDVVVAGLCTVDEPDCEDTVVVADPNDQPVDDGTGLTPAGGMVVGGGLTVDEALGTDATGILAVRGFLLDDGTGVRMCDALAESYPPQCGGAASLDVSGFTIDQVGDLVDDESGVQVQTEGTTTWTDQPVLLFGEIVDGTFVVSTDVA